MRVPRSYRVGVSTSFDKSGVLSAIGYVIDEWGEDLEQYDNGCGVIVTQYFIKKHDGELAVPFYRMRSQ